MRAEQARERALEIAKYLDLNLEHTAELVSEAERLCTRAVSALDAKVLEHVQSARQAQNSPLHGAMQLLLTTLREEAVVEMLPEDKREEYVAQMHGIGYLGQVGVGLQPEIDPIEAAAEAERAAAEQHRIARAQQAAELRKNPALMDPKHKDHDAAVAALVKFHEEDG